MKSRNTQMWKAWITALLLVSQASAHEVPHYEHLRIRNQFSTALEVVHYFVERNASGFIWAGMLDSEREAFTEWMHAPESEDFLIADQYRLERVSNSVIRVHYHILAMADHAGATTPPLSPDYTVQFVLRCKSGVWKIAEPAANEIKPVLLKNQLPPRAHDVVQK